MEGLGRTGTKGIMMFRTLRHRGGGRGGKEEVFDGGRASKFEEKREKEKG